MRKLFIGYSLELERLSTLKSRLEQIVTGTHRAGYNSFIFTRDVQNWRPHSMDMRSVLERTFSELRECSCVLLDCTSDSNNRRTGVKIEGGFAKALNKKIICLMKEGDRPRMLADLADIEIFYKTDDEIQNQVYQALMRLERDLDSEQGVS